MAAAELDVSKPGTIESCAAEPHFLRVFLNGSITACVELWGGRFGRDFVRQPSNKRFASAGTRCVRIRILTAAVIASSVIMLCMTLSEASAKTKVDGDSSAVALTVEAAPISEVLAALSAKFDFIYTPTPGLDRTIGGIYTGTVQQVLERVLDGCDYVVSFSGDKIELKVLGPSGSTARPLGLSPQPNLLR
jgi:hypothetical protein